MNYAIASGTDFSRQISDFGLEDPKDNPVAVIKNEVGDKYVMKEKFRYNFICHLFVKTKLVRIGLGTYSWQGKEEMKSATAVWLFFHPLLKWHDTVIGDGGGRHSSHTSSSPLIHYGPVENIVHKLKPSDALLRDEC